MASFRVACSSLESPRSELRSRVCAALEQELGFVTNPEFDRDRRRPETVWREVERGCSRLGAAPPEDGGSSHAIGWSQFEQIGGAPLLNVEEERLLFREYNFCKYRANRLRSRLDARRPSTRHLSDYEEFVSVALRIRQRIVSANLRLVASLVKGFVTAHQTFDDLFSEGAMALFRATDNFDFARGFKFSTYATCAIRRELAHFAERQFRLRRQFVTGGASMFEAEEAERRSASWQHAGKFQSLMKMVGQLDERERYIVLARYGFESDRRIPTFESLGAELGVCKERVRQLESRALRKLRRFADANHFDPENFGFSLVTSACPVDTQAAR